MGKQELIIEALAFMQEEERKLLNESGKSMGWIVDKGFTSETRAFIKLMNKIYAIYDDLKAEVDAEVKELLESLSLKDYQKVEVSKISEIMKNYKPELNIKMPKIDFLNLQIKKGR